MTQEGFAERVEILVDNYRKIERGRINCTVDTLDRLAEALGVKIADLFTEPTNRQVRKGRPPKPT